MPGAGKGVVMATPEPSLHVGPAGRLGPIVSLEVALAQPGVFEGACYGSSRQHPGEEAPLDRAGPILFDVIAPCVG